jgi:hypothetical protein
MESNNPIYFSTELRWFFPGEIPDTIREWFGSKSSNKIKFEKSRTDTYLVFPFAQSCGVKFREGNFEIKALVNKPVTYGQAIARSWEKWSLGGLAAKAFIKSAGNDGNRWADIEKSRALIFYEVGEPLWQGLEPDYQASLICQFELSEIKRDKKWWSLNLEIGGKGNQSQFLLTAAEYLLHDCPLALTTETTKSYPLWLHEMYKK